MIRTTFDVIVIGVGSMGSSACYFLSQRGYKVLGIEQFDITHEHGSHARPKPHYPQSFFEHPDYVPLLNSAYDNWEKLEKQTGTQIYHRTGLVYFGKPDSAMLKGAKESASLYNVGLETIDSTSEIHRTNIL